MQKNRNNKGRQNKGRASARGKRQGDSPENANDSVDDKALDEVVEATPDSNAGDNNKAELQPESPADSEPKSQPESQQSPELPQPTEPELSKAETEEMTKPIKDSAAEQSALEAADQPQSDDAPAETVAAATPAQDPTQDTAKKPGKGAVIVAILALLIALLAVAGCVYLWMQQQQERTVKASDSATQTTQLQTLAGDLKNAAAGRDKNAAAITATQQQVAQIDGRLEGLNGQVSNIAGVIDLANQANASVKVYDTRIEQLEQGVGSLREIAEGGRNAWRKAEIEYLLVVANQRLQVYNDPKTAEAALKAADKRLLELGDAQLVPLRQLIADEITAVKSVERADVSGLAFSLGSHAERVSQLPIKRELGGKAHYSSGDEADKAAAEAAEKGVDWDKLWSGIYGELKTLVVVRRNGKPVEPMLPPAAEFFLEQNLRLKLESARAALLRGDSENFTASLRTAKSWLEAYFNGEDSAVQAMLASLSEMEGVNIAPTLPDISPSLTMLRQINQNAAQ